MDWAIAATSLTLIHLFLTIWLAGKAVAWLHGMFEDLDGRLAGAIQGILEQSGGDFEPVNPVQAAIAQFITAKMNQTPIEAIVRERDQDGKFT